MNINEYGRKPKAGVQVNYAKEIAQKTGARESAVKQWLDTNEVDPLTILQGIGSGRIKRNDFIDALMSDNGTLEFLNKYNSDGKWSSVWKGTPKNESNIQKVKKMIREIVLKEGVSDPELDRLDNDIFVAFRSFNEYIKRKYPVAYPDYSKLYKDFENQVNKINQKHDMFEPAN